MSARRPRDPELAIARRAKRAGITKEQYVELRSGAMRRSAASQAWRPSELAATLVDVQSLADRVWRRRRG